MMRVVRRGLSCDECGGTEFEKDDSGFYTCISCGVQRTVSRSLHDSSASSLPPLAADIHCAVVSSSAVVRPVRCYVCRRRRRSRSSMRPALVDRGVDCNCSGCQPHPNSRHTRSNVSPPTAHTHSKRPSYHPEHCTQSLIVPPVYRSCPVTLHDSRLLLETFHFLLHAQCDALLRGFQLTPHLVSVVGRLWVNYVRWWQSEGWGRDEEGMVVFKVAPGIKVEQTKRKVKEEEREWQQAKAENNAAETEQAQSEVDGQHGPEDSEIAANIPSSRPLDVAELSLPLSLAFLYVALQSCRCSITMHQLVSLARINRLPYLNFIQPSTLPPRLHTLLATAPSVRSFYRPSVLPSTPTLLRLAHHVCAVLGLASPSSGKRQREKSVRAAFGLHDEWFHVSGCVRAFMRQMHVPEALYGLCMSMTRVWTAVMRDNGRNTQSIVGRKRGAELRASGEEHDEEREDEKEAEEGNEGGVGVTSGGHDEWSVMVCIVTVLKLVYGLDRVADTETQQRKDEVRAEEGSAELENEEQPLDDEQEANAGEEGDEEDEAREVREGEDAEAQYASGGPVEQRPVTVVDRWQTEEEEMEEYRLLQHLHREEEEERQRQQQAEARLEHHCSTLLQMLADNCSPPPSTSLEADLVRLFNPSTHFPASLYEARHMRPDQQEDMLRLWDEAILPPSLAIDDYGEYIDKMNALHPPLDSDAASAAADKPSLASLWRHLSTNLSHSHHATYRQYSQSRSYAAQPLHADYQLVVHCGGLLCGLSADSLHRRVWRWGQLLWRWMGRRRYHSVTWKKEDREHRLWMERQRRKRKRNNSGAAESEAEEQQRQDEAEHYGQRDNGAEDAGAEDEERDEKSERQMEQNALGEEYEDNEDDEQ